MLFNQKTGCIRYTMYLVRICCNWKVKKREITKEKYLSIKFIKIFSLKNTKYFYLTRIKNYYFDITGNLMLRRMKMQMYLI